MDTMTAFAIGRANKNKEQMVFDWDKAGGKNDFNKRTVA